VRTPRLPFRSSSPLRRTAVAASIFVVAAALVTGAADVSASAAAAAQTVFVNEGFTGNAVANYIKPTAPSGSNVACLTASSDTTATPVPGCSSTAIDAVNSGALRLTSAGTTQEGGIGSTQSVPISKGLDASFDSYQYAGTKADGIVFYLAATDPYNPQVPTAIGQAGGSLGYSATGSSAGLAHGYLGLGLDDYGNYLNSNFGGSGCTNQPASSTQPANVSVRGPGNGSVGYCVLPGYNSNIGGATALHGSTRAASDVPVEVIINPASTSTTSAGTSKLTSITVDPTSYAIVFKTIGATSQTVVTGTLPDLRQTQYSGLVDSSWYDPSTGLPYKLTYGWVASTGGSTDIHEVNYLNAQTVNGPVPALTATSSASSSTVATGSTGTYTVNTAVSSGGGSESSPVQVTTTFPTGITPTASTGTDYSCSINGQTETCTYSGTTAAGSSLPALALPYTASGAPNSAAKSISSVVSSVDATAVNTASSVTVTKIGTTTTVSASPASPSYGATETLTANVGPSGATGTVAFVDTTSGVTLCAAAAVTSGVATCSVTASSVGTDSITATFSGSTNYTSSSGSTSVITTAASTTIGVSDSPAEIAYGQTSTLTATGLPSGATGAVSFTDAAGTVLCTTSSASHSCSTSASLGAGPYAMTADYAGDSHYSASDSATTVTLTVDKADTTLFDTANGTSAGSTSYGTPATLAASGIASGATGTVTFTDADSGTTLCTATLPVVSCATAGSLAAGTYAVHAVYSGDANHSASATIGDATLSVTKQAAPSVSASVDKPSVAFGRAATFTTSGVPSGATGTVTYTAAGGVAICTATLPAASCAIPATLPAGGYEVTATYSGDADHTGGSTSTPVSLEVVKAVTAVAATVNGSSSSSVPYGTRSNLDVSGLPTGATGTVTYTDQVGDVLCTTQLPAPSCTTVTDLAAGSYDVTAIYSGDANHLTSTAATVTLIVAKADAALTTTVDRQPAARITHGGSATLDTTGIPAGATGTVSYVTSDGTILCTATLPDTSCDTSATLAGGSYRVTALYSGDANHSASAGPTVSLVVAPQSVPMTPGATPGTPSAHTSGGTTTLTVTGMPTGATGTVTFSANGHVLCVVKLPARSCTTTALDPGTTPVVASYSGDSSYAASRASMSVTVPSTLTASALAFTGSTLPIALTSGVAAVIVALGALMIVAARRRSLAAAHRGRHGRH
jgi:hypothetical protein